MMLSLYFHQRCFIQLPISLSTVSEQQKIVFRQSTCICWFLQVVEYMIDQTAAESTVAANDS